ncbi:M20/M25/M40 family metallo-hydrolase [Sphingomonas sp. NIBR02145]|uniref:M20/M25/M40 family metallo-hydrolase n=1 Tax=Sphingomonas sp. NIBR02145 TaxID=3014784 RepID=UPI0022B3E484|nr:M20/M25/M40 family metallo-hydrolase [Sphingomonas sp. NIBR02145]WHU03602.1 M20/M25/M40 family metallo-hydrolase [Sphingomonas sp. NIBR02145]
MTKRTLLAAVAALALPFPALAQSAAHDPVALRDAALSDNLAWEITEGLTTEVGQRLAATEAEARARAWAVKKLTALGFKNVHIETYKMPLWERGIETAEVLGGAAQKLAIAALGNSGSTGPKPIEAEVVAFATLADLQAAPAAAVKGKIVYVGNSMTPTQDGSQYGYFGGARRAGPSIAASKGAAAILIRSIGTDYHRNPHTGVTSWAAGVNPIGAAALSLPDSDQLERLLKRGPVKLRVQITAGMKGEAESGNVIADVPGSDPSAGIILIGGHLDSWDLGTGAIDDASGVAITTAAAKRIMDAGQPKRTIRVVWFGAEEPGGFGGAAYAKAHANERHVLAQESDFGADRVWKFEVNLPAGAKPIADRLATVLAPLGISRGRGTAHGGTDVGPVINTGVGVVDLSQSGLRYFDYHHTPDDTLDKIDPVQLRQNVAAWTAMLAVTANAPEDIGPIPKGEGE